MAKKIISVLLTVVLVLGSMLAVFAETDPAGNIQISQDVYNLTVKVEAEKTGRLTAYIISADNTDTKIYSIAQTKEYTLEDDKVIYQFDLVLGSDMASGTYKLLLGDVYHADKEFEFVNVNDLLNFYNSLDTAAVDDVYTLLSDEDVKTSYDLTDYLALSDDVRYLVDKEIVNWSLAATLDTIGDVESAFKTNMDKEMLLANIADAKANNFETSVKAALKADILDDTFAEEVSAEAIREFMFPEDVTSIAAEDVSVQFDLATLLAIANSAGYVILSEATEYYVDKGIINVNAKSLKSIEKENLQYTLFKQLREANVATVEEFEETIKDLMSELLDEGSSSSSSSGSGGGKVNGGGYGGSSIGSTTRPSAKPSEDKPVTPVTFTDMGTATWAMDSVSYLASHGVINGKGNNLFVPNDTVTREEFVKMIILAFNSSMSNAGCAFEDVDTNRWSYPYIVTASDLGLVTGVNETTFNPTGGISREDLAVILNRAYKLTGKTAGKASVSFSDAGSIAGYAKDAVATLVGLGVMNGVGDGKFAPKAVVTRAQAAKAIYELLIVTGGVK